jgi:hypothetical protein
MWRAVWMMMMVVGVMRVSVCVAGHRSWILLLRPLLHNTNVPRDGSIEGSIDRSIDRNQPGVQRLWFKAASRLRLAARSWDQINSRRQSQQQSVGAAMG